MLKERTHSTAYWMHLQKITASRRTIGVDKTSADEDKHRSDCGSPECEPMKKLTLTVTEETYRSARIWATQCNLSISALVRSYLEILHGLPCPGVDAQNKNHDRNGDAAVLPPSPLGSSDFCCETVKGARQQHDAAA
jgi:hypothetical protein